MLVFYQTRSQHHKTIDLPAETCKTCGNRGTFKMHLMQKYVWIFAPFFPANKYAIIECIVCKTKLPRNEWTKDLDTIYKQEINKTKTPIRLWRGTIIYTFFALLFFIFYQLGYLKPAENLNASKKLNVSENKIAIQNIEENDVLFISINKGSKRDYSTLAKVTKIEIEKSTLLLYSENFDEMKAFTLKLSDFNETKFKKELIVKTKSLRKGTLLYENPPEEKFKLQAFGKVNSVIKN